MSDSDRVKTNTWGIGGEFIWFNQYRNQGYTYSVAPEDMFDLRWTATPPAWPQYPKMTDLLTIVSQKPNVCTSWTKAKPMDYACLPSVLSRQRHRS